MLFMPMTKPVSPVFQRHDSYVWVEPVKYATVQLTPLRLLRRRGILLRSQNEYVTTVAVYEQVTATSASHDGTVAGCAAEEAGYRCSRSQPKPSTGRFQP